MNDPKGTYQRLKQDLIVAGGIGAVSALSIAGVAAVMGHVGDTEARRLLEAIIPTSRLFCSSMLTVSATILALMLTMIGLGNQSDTKLADAHYERIMKIALYDPILFAGGAVLSSCTACPSTNQTRCPAGGVPQSTMEF